MNKSMEWIGYWVTNTIKKKFYKWRLLLFHIPIKHYREYIGEKRLLDTDQTQDKIIEAIVNNRPMMVCRFGNNELQMMIACLEHKMFPQIDHRQRALDAMCGIAGFFPNRIEMGERFSKLMFRSLKEVDILAWWNIFMQDYIVKKYLRNADICNWGDIFPWTEGRQNGFPWSKALKGKRVLLIHPFEKTIQEQYFNHRTEIFSKIDRDNNILPEFELITLRALQTMGGDNTYGFDSWFEAFQHMLDECKKKDFDVAIIGCGAYGFPLAAEIKKMGKISIHLGGATQLMFGIIGARWERDLEFMDKVVNEKWVRPSSQETPQNVQRFENGCYW